MQTLSSKAWMIPSKRDNWSLSELLERNGPTDQLQTENTSTGRGSFIKYKTSNLRAGLLNILEKESF